MREKYLNYKEKKLTFEDAGPKIKRFFDYFIEVFKEKRNEEYTQSIDLLLSKAPKKTSIYKCKDHFKKEPIGCYLYKYVKSEYAVETVGGHYLYFSDPRLFDDLEDCTFREISIPKRIRDDNDLMNKYLRQKELISVVREECQKEDFNQEQFTQMLSEDIIKSEGDEDSIMAFLNGLMDVLEDEYGPNDDNIKEKTKGLKVCCLTSLDDNYDMWEKYASNHTGVCLVIDWTKLKEHGLRPYEIVYGGHYDMKYSPKLWTSYYFSKYSRKKAEEMFYYLKALAYFSPFHKRARYRKESEWRLLSLNTKVDVREAIVDVYIGKNTPDNIVDSIHEIISKEPKRSKFCKNTAL